MDAGRDWGGVGNGERKAERSGFSGRGGGVSSSIEPGVLTSGPLDLFESRRDRPKLPIFLKKLDFFLTAEGVGSGGVVGRLEEEDERICDDDTLCGVAIADSAVEKEGRTGEGKSGLELLRCTCLSS